MDPITLADVVAGLDTFGLTAVITISLTIGLIVFAFRKLARR